MQIHSVFELLKTDPNSRARRGRLHTLHGPVETPVFMAVGTQGTVKGLWPEQLRSLGTQILLGNTYHLNLRPGSDLVRQMGGLHHFMGWEGPILTDSGGFQVFSLGRLNKVTEAGVAFRSHIDGARFFLGPEECMTIQANLGSDIAMVLDVCLPHPCKRAKAVEETQRTVRWAQSCLQVGRQNGFLEAGHHVFAIVQGGPFEDLRRECAQALVQMDFPGYAVGGVSVGEPEEAMLRAVEVSIAELPEHKPRYVMGLGSPTQLLQMVALGADMFDCVMPTRLARHGVAFTPNGVLHLRNRCHRDDPRPLWPEGGHPAYAGFSRAYIRHLFQAKESLAAQIVSFHNLYFFMDLMRQARAHLEAGDYSDWAAHWCAQYRAGSALSSRAEEALSPLTEA